MESSCITTENRPDSLDQQHERSTKDGLYEVVDRIVEHWITINGVSAGDISFSIAELSGEAFKLQTLADFNGNYTSFGAGITVAGGDDPRADVQAWR